MKVFKLFVDNIFCGTFYSKSYALRFAKEFYPGKNYRIECEREVKK